MSLRMTFLLLQEKLKRRRIERRCDMRRIYHWADGNTIYSCEYECIGEVDWKLAGSDRKVKICKDSEEAIQETKLLNGE